MQLKDKVIVVTGGGSGIGRAMCLRFAKEGPAAIVVADINGEAASNAAAEVTSLSVAGAWGTKCDVTDEVQVKALVAEATARFGRVDLFCSNAGFAIGKDENAPDSDWTRSWDL